MTTGQTIRVGAVVLPCCHGSSGVVDLAMAGEVVLAVVVASVGADSADLVAGVDRLAAAAQAAAGRGGK